MPQGHAKVVREMVVPVLREHKIVAILGIGNKKRDYVEKDVQIVSELADMAWDIVLRKRAEEELMRLISAVEQSAESIVITDINGTIQYVNPTFERVTGYPIQEAVGQNPRILKSDKQDEDFYRQMWKTLLSGNHWTGRLVNKKKDKTLFTEEASISPVFDKSEKIINFVAVKRDITKEIQLENQLRQAQKMESIGTLAGGIAHDFNNILSAILGYSDLIKMEQPEGSEIYDDATQIEQASHRARDLVTQILTFCRMKETEFEPIRIDIIIKEALKLLRSSIPTTIEIKSRIENIRELVLADSTQIHQIIMNLCTNACHAMEDKGGILKVNLSVKKANHVYGLDTTKMEEKKFLKLVVKDTGYGISEEIIENIFDPYFTTKDLGEGTGLGLSVVQGIVKSYGGDIAVTSSPGEGTEFTIHFPVTEMEKKKKTVTESDSIEGGNEKILLIDDEPNILKIGKKMLERIGYQVTMENDSEKALEKIQSNPGNFDLIITDMTMPRMDGATLARKVLEDYPELPIILCTGYSDRIIKEKIKDIGIKALINKPMSFPVIAGEIRQI